MTAKDIKRVVGDIGLPFAYYQFGDDHPVQPPFIVYTIEEDAFNADNSNYATIATVLLDLVTDYKDFETEKRIETTLANNGFTWMKDADEYNTEERVYQVGYRFNVLMEK